MLQNYIVKGIISKLMKESKGTLSPAEWKKIVWEKTPYKGVFIHKVAEEPDLNNPDIPKHTIMALKLEPRAIIPLHIHKREAGWTETIILPNGGLFEIFDNDSSRKITTKDSHTIVIKPYEPFGIKNRRFSKPLYFLSLMKPGFTGYGEIEEVKKLSK